MPGRWVIVWAVLAGGAAGAGTIQVTNANSSGPGGLDAAVAQANSRPGPDLITFAEGLAGVALTNLQSYYTLTDPGTHVDGDLNDDGTPDIQLNGNRGLRSLRVNGGNDCVLEGLAVYNTAEVGIDVENASGVIVKGCYVGVGINGRTPLPNGGTAVVLSNCTECRVGGQTPLQRNVICVGSPPYGNGIGLSSCTDCQVWGNYIGVAADGRRTLLDDPGGEGLYIYRGSGNRIGGDIITRGNTFGGVGVGIRVAASPGNVISGNTFGLLSNGVGPAPVRTGIRLEGAGGNVIGGTVRKYRNVFANADTGVDMYVPEADNKIQGNYFGYTADGRASRPLLRGIGVGGGSASGRQIIGGSLAARNWFASDDGVALHGSGDQSQISYNKFGYWPTGAEGGPGSPYSVYLTDVRCTITDNRFLAPEIAINGRGSKANLKIFRNVFSGASHGVILDESAAASLGNLGNGATDDDGGNVFVLQQAGQLSVENHTALAVKAEGNDWGTTDFNLIEQQIVDRLDDSRWGRVDYKPLAGGASSAGLATAAPILSAVAAVPAGMGAEIVFTLSAPGAVRVEVVNLAGRVVAAPVDRAACGAGTQRVLWDGRGVQGTVVPAGQYLIRIRAQGERGGQVEAVRPLVRRR
jgi:hypothetical protein